MRKKAPYKGLPAASLILGLFFLIQPFTRAAAQGTFTFRAALDTVRKAAFYKLELQPELVAKCRPDLGDLRIVAPDGQFVPYVLMAGPDTGDPSKDWLSIPGGAVIQKDSNNKHSYLTLRYAEPYLIDWLTVGISSPVFYKREAQVAVEGAQAGESAWITSIVIDPQHLRFRLPHGKARELRIDIANADNAPLTIDRIAGFQSPRYLLTYLEADSAYEILAGNPQAAAPEYDLKYFTDTLNRLRRMLTPGHVQLAHIPAQPVVAAVTGKEVNRRGSGVLLWGSLLAVLVLLVYFSIRMVRAIGQRETHDRL